MPWHHAQGVDAREARRCHLLLAAILLVSALGHLFYLTHDCPLDLAPDEAHYWDWARHPDWSYYSKGPLVAWLIHGSCTLFGPLSVQLTGSVMPAVRLPAVACGTLMLLGLYTLTLKVYRNPRLALGVVVVGLTFPLVTAGSMLMTIDSPYTCCWMWALVFGHRALFEHSRWAWLWAGLCIGIGILAKYTMVLWLPSLGLFLLTNSSYRSILWRPGLWVMVLTSAVCCAPILVWNIQHDWVTFKHVNSLASNQSAEPVYYWAGPLKYVAGQCLLLFVFWFFAWVCAMWENRPWRQPDPAVRYLWWLSVPTFANFLIFSVKNDGGEINWPITAYLSGMVLTASWMMNRLQSPRVWLRRALLGAAIGVSVVGLFITVTVHHTELLHPVFENILGQPSEKHPMPMRRLDPTCRLRGWRTLAGEVDQLRLRIQAEEGRDPVVAGTRWDIPGELGVYCADHPPVYSIGIAVADRHSQYDLWHPNPVADPQAFHGRTFIIVGPVDAAYLALAFERVERPQMVVHYEKGRPLARWQVTVAHGFHGFPQRHDGGVHY